MLNLTQLENKLDNQLAKETTESLTNWLSNKRNKMKPYLVEVNTEKNEISVTVLKDNLWFKNSKNQRKLESSFDGVDLLAYMMANDEEDAKNIALEMIEEYKKYKINNTKIIKSSLVPVEFHITKIGNKLNVIVHGKIDDTTYKSLPFSLIDFIKYTTGIKETSSLLFPQCEQEFINDELIDGLKKWEKEIFDYLETLKKRVITKKFMDSFVSIMIKSLNVLLEMIIITILGAVVIIINSAILIAETIINTKQSEDDY